MAHNGYFYPDDVIVTVVNGQRVARIGWELPTIWTDAAKAAAEKVDYLTGWEMAREAYRKAQMDDWYRRTYPDHWDEWQRSKAHYAAGGSVVGFHVAEGK